MGKRRRSNKQYGGAMLINVPENKQLVWTTVSWMDQGPVRVPLLEGLTKIQEEGKVPEPVIPKEVPEPVVVKEVPIAKPVEEKPVVVKEVPIAKPEPVIPKEVPKPKPEPVIKKKETPIEKVIREEQLKKQQVKAEEAKAKAEIEAKKKAIESDPLILSMGFKKNLKETLGLVRNIPNNEEVVKIIEKLIEKDIINQDEFNKAMGETFKLSENKKYFIIDKVEGKSQEKCMRMINEYAKQYNIGPFLGRGKFGIVNKLCNVKTGGCDNLVIKIEIYNSQTTIGWVTECNMYKLIKERDPEELYKKYIVDMVDCWSCDVSTIIKLLFLKDFDRDIYEAIGNTPIRLSYLYDYLNLLNNEQIKNNFNLYYDLKSIVEADRLGYIVMESYGQNLESIINERYDKDIAKGIKWQTAIGNAFQEVITDNIMFQMFNIIDYLHSKGILHLDAKPRNWLIKNGEVKIIDFSLALDLSEVRDRDWVIFLMLWDYYFIFSDSIQYFSENLKELFWNRFNERVDTLIEIFKPIKLPNRSNWILKEANTPPLIDKIINCINVYKTSAQCDIEEINKFLDKYCLAVRATNTSQIDFLEKSIMNIKDPALRKKVEDLIKNFDEDKYDEIKEEIEKYTNKKIFFIIPGDSARGECENMVNKWINNDIGKEIGEGAFGKIYELCETKNKCINVLKVILLFDKEEYGTVKTSIKAFKNECMIAKRLSDKKYAVQTLDCWTCPINNQNKRLLLLSGIGATTDCIGYIVMERLEGGTYLKDISKNQVTEKVIDKIYSTIEQLHEDGVAHMDLNWANIYIKKGSNIKLFGFGKDNEVKLIDFGRSIMLDQVNDYNIKLLFKAIDLAFIHQYIEDKIIKINLTDYNDKKYNECLEKLIRDGYVFPKNKPNMSGVLPKDEFGYINMYLDTMYPTLDVVPNTTPVKILIGMKKDYSTVVNEMKSKEQKIIDGNRKQNLKTIEEYEGMKEVIDMITPEEINAMSKEEWEAFLARTLELKPEINKINRYNLEYARPDEASTMEIKFLTQEELGKINKLYKEHLLTGKDVDEDVNKILYRMEIDPKCAKYLPKDIEKTESYILNPKIYDEKYGTQFESLIKSIDNSKLKDKSCIKFAITMLFLNIIIPRYYEYGNLFLNNYILGNSEIPNDVQEGLITICVDTNDKDDLLAYQKILSIVLNIVNKFDDSCECMYKENLIDAIKNRIELNKQSLEVFERPRSPKSITLPIMEGGRAGLLGELSSIKSRLSNRGLARDIEYVMNQI